MTFPHIHSAATVTGNQGQYGFSAQLKVCSSWFTGYSLCRSEHDMCISSIIQLVTDAVNSIPIVIQVATNKYIIYSSTALLS